MSLSANTISLCLERLAGQRSDFRSLLAFIGPALVASVAYMDPGNFATNIQAGAGYNYDLLWVVLSANLVAMLFQALSAKIGIVTGESLPELCRRHFPRKLVWVMWVISEIAAMATDLAEFLGGAIGLSLLFGLPLLVGMGIIAVITYAVLLLQQRGFRPAELLIGALIGVIGISYIAELFIVPPDWRLAASGLFMPTLPDEGAVILATGIIGATVMPHAIYLHSGLTQNRIPVRNEKERKRLIRFSHIEVLFALGFAGFVNLAMVMMAAAAFHRGHPEVAEIESAYHTLVPLLGGAAAGIFLLALIASGLSSSVVGTMAGQMIMQGFVHFKIPVWVRRLVTMIPAFVVVACGVNATKALVLSQVVLSLALPVPMIALLLLTRQRKVMGSYVNTPLISGVAMIAAALVLILNGWLIVQTVM